MKKFEQPKIKTFEEFRLDIDPYNEEKWENEFLFKIRCTSHANVPENVDMKNLEETIRYTVRSLIDEDTPHGEFAKQSYDKALKDYPDNEIVKFQYDTITEIRRLTIDTYNFKIENNKLIMSCEFDITLPDFDYDDIKEWIHEESLGQIVSAYDFNEMENLVSKKGRNKQYGEIRDIFKEIRKNARVIVD